MTLGGKGIVWLTLPYRTDIEQEANGMYTFDRKEKLDADKVKAVVDAALQVFYERVSKTQQ